MSVSRRGFGRSLVGRSERARVAPAWISARGREAWVGELGSLSLQDGAAPAAAEPEERTIRLSSNENPLGPSEVALQAIDGSLVYAGRYPMNAIPAIADFAALVAERNGLETTQVGLGSGSGEVLNCAVRAFAGADRGVVTATPSYEEVPRAARGRGVPVVEVPVDEGGRLDLDAMIAASSGAGLVFLCNPNNPTAAVHPADRIADTIAKIETASPDTVVLVDEAYHDYVTDPAYASAVSLIPRHRNLLVARTMSKAHGMAGLRLGYGMGQPDLIARLNQWLTPFSSNAMVVAASVASLRDDAGMARERDRNTAARRFTVEFFNSAGYQATDSQTNFIFVNLGKPAEGFRTACREQGIAVGRDFPPMEKTHCRISIGTMEEMQRAVEVFKTALNA